MAKNLMLMTIVIFALCLRLWQLDKIPPSLFSDEVDIAYQVKVFRSTGADYYGNKFPIHFHSFADWRTGAQIYSSVIISFFTNNDIYIVRLPSVIYSVLSVVFIYLITGSLYAPLLLAISPWSIHYGRTGFEVSGMIMCLLAAIYFFKNQKFYLFSIFLCLSPYFYSTAKLFIPILFCLLIYIYIQDIQKLTKKSIILLIIFNFLLLLPMGIDTLKGHSGFRFSYISIFTQPSREQTTDKLRYQDALIDNLNQVGVQTTLVSKLIHNKYELIINRFITNYISSFSTNFLLLNGDENSRHGFGNHGLIYIIDSLFVIIGIFTIFCKKQKDKLSLLFFWMLVLAPIPFSLTRDTNSPHATRLILMLPSLIYFSTIGITTAIQKYKYIIIPIYIIYLFSVFNFIHYYKYHYSNDNAAVWHAGIKESIIDTNQYQNNNIYFSNFYEPAQPFFLNYRPYILKSNDSITNHLAEINNSSIAGLTLDSKYFFGRINWSNLNDIPEKSIIVVPEMENNQVPNSLILINKTNKNYTTSQNFYIYEK